MMFDPNYEVLGAFGSAQDGEAFLARERVTGHLVALRVDKQGPPDQSVSVARTLGGSVPADALFCAKCNYAIGDWRRFCPSCGADQAGASVPADQARSLLEAAVRESENRLEILGQMPRAEGGAAVYFGSEPISGRIVAFSLRADGRDKNEGLSVNVTSVLRVPAGGAPETAAAASESFTALFLNPKSDPRFQAVNSRGDASPDRVTGPGGTKTCPACGKEYDAQTRFCPDDGSVLRQKTTPENLVGEVIADRYHVLSKIGQGGMGQVYLAEHVRIGRRCAIKVLNHALVDDVDSINRFSREAANAARVKDENVADIYDFGESKDHGIYLAMEYVEGEPLSRIIAREAPLAADRTMRIAIQVARGLAAAHRGGVIHRDLTPNNVVIGASPEGERVKIVDFGIAKALQDPHGGMTKTGLVVGTPQYMSPEQLIGDSVDARGDIYQLGYIMFEMLTGTRPFANRDGAEQVTRRLSEPPPHVRDRVPNVPTGLDEIVARSMATMRDDRFESAQTVRVALEKELRQWTAPPDTGVLSGLNAAASGTPRLGSISSEIIPPIGMATAPSTPPQPTQSAGWREGARTQPPTAGTISGSNVAVDVGGSPPNAARRFTRRGWLSGMLGAGFIAVASIVIFTRDKTPPQSTAIAPPPAATPAPGPVGEKKVDPPPAQPQPQVPDAQKAKVTPPGLSRGRAQKNPQGTLKLSGQLPPGAEIRVDGRPVSIGASGLSLSPGTYELTITATGFESVRDSVRIIPDVVNLFAVAFRRAESKQAPVAEPEVPRTRPPAVFSPATAAAEIETALKAFVAALSLGREADVRALFPGISDVQVTQLFALRGDGRVTLDIDYRAPRRLDPAGSVSLFTLWLRETGRPPIPVPYQATLIHQSTGWRLTQFARRE